MDTPQSDYPALRSWGDLALASALGFGIAVLLLLPPVLHLCSGPLGPLAGGFVSGNRLKVPPQQGPYVGFGMGLLAAIIAGSIAMLQKSLEYALLGIVVVAYVAGLGTLGAIIGGQMARQG